MVRYAAIFWRDSQRDLGSETPKHRFRDGSNFSSPFLFFVFFLIAIAIAFVDVSLGRSLQFAFVSWPESFGWHSKKSASQKRWKILTRIITRAHTQKYYCHDHFISIKRSFLYYSNDHIDKIYFSVRERERKE